MYCHLSTLIKLNLMPFYSILIWKCKIYFFFFTGQMMLVIIKNFQLCIVKSVLTRIAISYVILKKIEKQFLRLRLPIWILESLTCCLRKGTISPNFKILLLLVWKTNLFCMFTTALLKINFKDIFLWLKKLKLCILPSY